MDGSEIRARRKALGLSQDAFAAKVGLSRDFVGQLERGIAHITPTVEAAIRSARAGPDIFAQPKTRDPMERQIEEALIESGIRYQTDIGGDTKTALDFYLPDFDVSLEVKRFYSARTGEQMARAPNVIVAQGEAAVRFLATAIRSGDFIRLLIEERT